VGFSLQGLSRISRCPSNLAQDNHVRAVRYDTSDHFCLDGARLVQVAANADSKGSTVEYRTFPDQLAKIVAHYPAGWGVQRGPRHFEVFTRFAGMPRPLLNFGSQRRRDPYPTLPSFLRPPPCSVGEPQGGHASAHDPSRAGSRAAPR
jgi:hypothetical protein